MENVAQTLQEYTGAVDRGVALPVGGRTLTMPCFFAAVSSVKAGLPLLECLQVLTALNYPCLLVSAYDIYHASRSEQLAVRKRLLCSMEAGAAVLIDSGGYESYWMRDSGWTRELLADVLRDSPHHLAFCYDCEAHVKGNRGAVTAIVQEVVRNQAYTPSGTVLPIVHGNCSVLPILVAGVARRLQPLLLAVAERELGNGVVERACTLLRIRRSLNELGRYYHLHLLGTGDPLSVLIYAVCGADSFDGLEWCQTCVDHESARLFHLHQWDFFSSQTRFGAAVGLPYQQLVLAHNLVFYRDWLARIADALGSGRGPALIEEHVPPGVAEAISARM